MENIRQKILELMSDIGYFIEDASIDVDIRDYIIDSIEFIGFIVQLEEKLNISFPDEYLMIDTLESLNGLANLLSSIGEEMANE